MNPLYYGGLGQAGGMQQGPYGGQPMPFGMEQLPPMAQQPQQPPPPWQLQPPMPPQAPQPQAPPPVPWWMQMQQGPQQQQPRADGLRLTLPSKQPQTPQQASQQKKNPYQSMGQMGMGMMQGRGMMPYGMNI